MVFGTDREFPPIYGLLEAAPARRLPLRRHASRSRARTTRRSSSSTTASRSRGGLDLTHGAGTRASTRPDDPRRTCGEKPYPPFHDVMIAVDGEAARQLAQVARERWRYATGQAAEAGRGRSGDPWPAELERRPATDVRGRASPARLPPTEDERAGGAPRRDALPRHDRAARATTSTSRTSTSPREKIGEALEERLASPTGPRSCGDAPAQPRLARGDHDARAAHAAWSQTLRAADMPRPLPRVLPARRGPRRGHLHRPALEGDDRRRRVAAHRLVQPHQPLDGRGHRVRRHRSRRTATRRVQRAIREFRDRLLAEHLGTEPRRSSARSSAPAACTAPSPRSATSRAPCARLEELPGGGFGHHPVTVAMALRPAGRAPADRRRHPVERPAGHRRRRAHGAARPGRAARARPPRAAPQRVDDPARRRPGTTVRRAHRADRPLGTHRPRRRRRARGGLAHPPRPLRRRRARQRHPRPGAEAEAALELLAFVAELRAALGDPTVPRRWTEWVAWAKDAARAVVRAWWARPTRRRRT